MNIALQYLVPSMECGCDDSIKGGSSFCFFNVGLKLEGGTGSAINRTFSNY